MREAYLILSSVISESGLSSIPSEVLTGSGARSKARINNLRIADNKRLLSVTSLRKSKVLVIASLYICRVERVIYNNHQV